MAYNDEILSAYIDGELSSEEAAALDAALATDDALQMQLRQLTHANKAVCAAYGSTGETPFPKEVLRLLHGNNEEKSRSGGYAAALRRAIRSISLAPWAYAAAATLMLMVGLAIGHYVPVSKSGFGNAQLLPIAGEIPAHSPLFETLESAESMTERVIDPRTGAKAVPLLSFASIDGRLCREFLVSSPADRARAVACRSESRWDVVIAIESELHVNADNQYRAASSAPDTLLSQYLEGFMASDAFNAAEEREFIATGWKTPRLE